MNIHNQKNLDSKEDSQKVNDSEYCKSSEISDLEEINRVEKATNNLQIHYKILIFDQTNEMSDFERRKKAQEDVSHLKKQFENFKVECVKDKTRDEIKEILIKLSKKEFSKNESIILFVKCSGCDEWIKSSDLGFVKHTDFIETITKNQSLENKLKFICISSINSFGQNVVSKYLISEANLIEKLDENRWDEHFLAIEQTKSTE